MSRQSNSIIRGYIDIYTTIFSIVQMFHGDVIVCSRNDTCNYYNCGIVSRRFLHLRNKWVYSVAICVNVDINTDQLCIEKDITYLVPFTTISTHLLALSHPESHVIK